MPFGCFSAKAVKKDEEIAVVPLVEAKQAVECYKHGVRTSHDSSVLPGDALDKLREGNERFVKGPETSVTNFKPEYITALATHGQRPMAAILGCADSRAPIEIMFDVQPGDVFVLRNAGNTLSHAEGSVVGSLEYCIGPLGSKLILVLGHTKCGAMMGATQMMLNAQKSTEASDPAKQTTLEKLLEGLGSVAAQAQQELRPDASADDIAAHTVNVSVFSGMARLLSYSESIREKVKSGEVQLHGAVYDIVTGKVKFLGQHPLQAALVSADKGVSAVVDKALGA